MRRSRSPPLARLLRDIAFATVPLSAVGLACGSSDGSATPTDGGGGGAAEGGGGGSEGGGPSPPTNCDPATDPCQCRFLGPTTFHGYPLATCEAGSETRLDAGRDADCVAADAGRIFPPDCLTVCGLPDTSQCFIGPGDGGYALTCITGCVGRLPEGLAAQSERGEQGERDEDDAGRWLAEIAYLEAASVHAFAILARELRAHRAPARLVRAAERAKRDEKRHARVMARLARRAGARPDTPRAPRKSVRPLERIAVENAVEGCVRETYGALLALWQGRAAEDPRLRESMSRIARDETRHAELAWAIARWAEPRLARDARRRVDAARSSAWRTLEVELTREPSPELARVLGLPPSFAVVRMARELGRRASVRTALPS